MPMAMLRLGEKNMELDELKSSWQSLDRRVGELTAMNRRLLAETVTRKARWRLAPVAVGAVLNMVIGGWFALVWGAFWSAHLDNIAVAVAGIALHLASIGLIVIGAVRLYLLLRIDYTQPVLMIQRSLARLQEFEARSFHVVWFGCWVLLPAALIAVVMGFAGVDLWERASGYILVNFLVCLAGGLAPPLLHFWARRRRSRLAARMDAFLLSRSIARARAAIDEIDEFARS
jgi:hypothetical protein